MDEVGAWTDLLGYEALLARCLRLWRNRKLPRVLLLAGRPGLAKMTFAHALAALPFCQQASACGQCSACLQVRRGQHRDVLHLLGTGSIKLEDVQPFLALLPVKPASGDKGARVWLMRDIERLTPAAGNALLKAVEEPPEHALIIFTSSNPRAVLPTLLSRCVRFPIQPPPRASGIAWLTQRHLGEHEAALLWEQFGGALGLAVQAAENKNRQIKESCVKLLLASDSCVILDEALNLSKTLKISASELVDCCERILNEFYRGFEPHRAQTVAPQTVRRVVERRRVLARVRRLAGKQKIALNVQLVAEAIGFANTMG